MHQDPLTHEEQNSNQAREYGNHDRLPGQRLRMQFLEYDVLCDGNLGALVGEGRRASDPLEAIVDAPGGECEGPREVRVRVPVVRRVVVPETVINFDFLRSQDVPVPVPVPVACTGSECIVPLREVKVLWQSFAMLIHIPEIEGRLSVAEIVRGPIQRSRLGEVHR